MNTAIETLQDRIIYLTGQIVIIEKEDIQDIAKKVAVKGWVEEIKELKYAQTILSNHK